MTLAVFSRPEIKNTWRYTYIFAMVFLYVVVLNQVHAHSPFNLTDRIDTQLHMSTHMWVHFYRVLTTEYIVFDP
jgi:uncharacterized membrane protein